MEMHFFKSLREEAFKKDERKAQRFPVGVRLHYCATNFSFCDRILPPRPRICLLVDQSPDLGPMTGFDQQSVDRSNSISSKPWP